MPTRKQYDAILSAISLAYSAAIKGGFRSVADDLHAIYNDVAKERDALARPVS